MASPERVPPTTLYLIRHGEPEIRYHGCYYGQMDVPLSDRGREQSRAVALRLADVPFSAIYASDLVRTIYLAEQLASQRAAPAPAPSAPPAPSPPSAPPVRRLAALRERHMGAFQGIPVETLERDHGPIFSQWLKDRIFFRCPEAENFVDLRGRVLPAVAEIVARHPGETVVLAGHAGPIRLIIGEALGMALENIFRLGIDHCGVHIIEYRPDEPARVTLMNG